MRQYQRIPIGSEQHGLYRRIGGSVSTATARSGTLPCEVQPYDTFVHHGLGFNVAAKGSVQFFLQSLEMGAGEHNRVDSLRRWLAQARYRIHKDRWSGFPPRSFSSAAYQLGQHGGSVAWPCANLPNSST
ncbi:MAG: hypothetical protein H6918_12610 [Sphingomonadaceae bacterium]|nr:hypothetical protein [Sphingomonadaceae bacterium]